MIRAVALTMALLAQGQVAAAECAIDRVDLRGAWGSARFSVEVADDDRERGLGLMNRPSMPTMHGMLFLYPAPTHAAFWMKNTLIPLDMLFLSPEGRVLRIHENAKPLDTTTIDGGEGVLAVLEINGGMARRLGIAVGSELRHPGLDPAIAAWPCD